MIRVNNEATSSELSLDVQTCNLLIRSQMLYSVEPRGLSLNCDAKVRTFFYSTKLLNDFF